MMRVLHIGTEKKWRGGENQIHHLVMGLKSRYSVENWVAYPKGTKALERFSHLCPVLPLPSANAQDVRSIFALAKWIKQNQIHVVDAHSSGAHSLALWVKKICPAFKLIVHRRVDNVIQDRWWTRKKYLHPGVDRFVAISHCIGQMLINYGINKEKVKVVRSAVSSEPYLHLSRKDCAEKWRQRFQISSSTFLLGSASALTPQKGPDTLLHALAHLRKTLPAHQSFHCLIAGEGHMKKELLHLTHKLDLTQFVTFLGFIDQVPSFLSALDALILPSRHEGLGTLILDAMLAGTPVIATKVGGIPEMVRHENTGLLVPAEDALSLAQAITTLMDSSALRNQLSSNALIMVKKDFSLSSMVSGNWEVYHS